MTYRGASGRQFVLIAAGGHGKLGTRRGDWVVAYALPEIADPPRDRVRLLGARAAPWMQRLLIARARLIKERWRRRARAARQGAEPERAPSDRGEGARVELACR